jgi:hypothetical protein
MPPFSARTSGVPLSVVIDGANRHDSQLLEETLDSIAVPRPEINYAIGPQ